MFPLFFCVGNGNNQSNTATDGWLIMGVTEKAAYLRGLLKGLDIDESTKEGKLLAAIVDVIDDMADSIADLEDVCDELDEVVEVLDEDLNTLEEDFYQFDEYDDDEDDDDCDCCDDDEDLYEVTCPECGDTVYLDGGMLEEGSMHCPNCDSLLEFEYDPEEETEE
jgi:hypothetical protein